VGSKITMTTTRETRLVQRVNDLIDEFGLRDALAGIGRVLTDKVRTGDLSDEESYHADMISDQIWNTLLELDSKDEDSE
jgi:hypothetical protein